MLACLQHEASGMVPLILSFAVHWIHGVANSQLVRLLTPMLTRRVSCMLKLCSARCTLHRLQLPVTSQHTLCSRCLAWVCLYQKPCKPAGDMQHTTNNNASRRSAGLCRCRCGVAATMFSALAKSGVNIKAISQGCSEYNITAVISQVDSVRALRAVHAVFYLS